MEHKIMSKPLPEILDELDEAIAELRQATKEAKEATAVAKEAAQTAKLAGEYAGAQAKEAAEAALAETRDNLMKEIEGVRQLAIDAMKLAMKINDAVVAGVDAFNKKIKE